MSIAWASWEKVGPLSTQCSNTASELLGLCYQLIAHRPPPAPASKHHQPADT